jgi:hypothetical protein
MRLDIETSKHEDQKDGPNISYLRKIATENMTIGDIDNSIVYKLLDIEDVDVS